MNETSRLGVFTRHWHFRIHLGGSQVSEMNLELAKKVTDNAEKDAGKIDVQIVISIVDAGAIPIATHITDDAWIASLDVARNKAWTSVAFKMPTANFAEATVPNGELYGFNTTNNG